MLIRAQHRGATQTTWLNSRHSFSFADYHDPAHMGFSALRVINQDVIAPDQGFGMHSHHNMEILTYVLKGVLQHRDSLGNESVIRRGEVQRMSAGSGIRHSEWNPSATEACALLQIWIKPEQEGGAPSYEQNLFPEPTPGQWQLLVSPDGAGDALKMQQTAWLYRAHLETDSLLNYAPQPNRVLWLQVLSGNLQANEFALETGDGLGLSTALALKGGASSEILLFDLPASA